MKTLVTYATRHGATKGIAVHIGQALSRAGLDVTVRPISQAPEVDNFDAVVIGAAAYMGRWLKEATDFVRRNETALATRPVWLFSSGPTGKEDSAEKREHVLEASRPHEFAELASLVHPRDERVFYGAYDPEQPAVGLAERFLSRLEAVIPAAREGIPAGDFREWPDIEAWAQGIATELKALEPVAAGV